MLAAGKKFKVQATIENHKAIGEGYSKKEAKTNAAVKLLKIIKENEILIDQSKQQEKNRERNQSAHTTTNKDDITKQFENLSITIEIRKNV